MSLLELNLYDHIKELLHPKYGDKDVHLARVYKGGLDVGVLAPLRDVLLDLALQAIKEHDRQYSTS